MYLDLPDIPPAVGDTFRVNKNTRRRQKTWKLINDKILPGCGVALSGRGGADHEGGSAGSAGRGGGEVSYKLIPFTLLYIST